MTSIDGQESEDFTSLPGGQPGAEVGPIFQSFYKAVKDVTMGRPPSPMPVPPRVPECSGGKPSACLANPPPFVIYDGRAFRPQMRPRPLAMRLTLLESDRSFLQSAECATVAILAHAGVILFAVTATHGGRQLPVDEREARVFFLLPPDRVDVRSRQMESLHFGKIGSDLTDGLNLTEPDEGFQIRERAYGARRRGRKTGARGQLPFGPPPMFVARHRLQRARGGQDGGALREQRGAGLSPGADRAGDGRAWCRRPTWSTPPGWWTPPR